MTDGRFRTAIGRDGTLLFGEDFPVEGGKGYVINMLFPTAVAMEGVPLGVPIEGAAAPSSMTEPVWAFAVGGQLEDAVVLPPGTLLPVLNARTGGAVEVPIGEDGRFAASFVDAIKRGVMEESDLLRFELVTPAGYALGARADRRVTSDDMRRAFVTVNLSARPATARLLPNYPNPFNPETWIPFELHEGSTVVVRIHNMQGEAVRRLDLGYRDAEYHHARGAAAYWNGRNEFGEKVANGVYFYELIAGSYHASRRMVIRK